MSKKKRTKKSHQSDGGTQIPTPTETLPPTSDNTEGVAGRGEDVAFDRLKYVEDIVFYWRWKLKLGAWRFHVRIVPEQPPYGIDRLS